MHSTTGQLSNVQLELGATWISYILLSDMLLLVAMHVSWEGELIVQLFA